MIFIKLLILVNRFIWKNLILQFYKKITFFLLLMKLVKV